MSVQIEKPGDEAKHSGIFFVVKGAFWFSLGVLCIRIIGHRLPVIELALGRCIFGLAIVYYMARRAGVATPRGGYAWLIARGFLGFLPLVGSFYAYAYLPMADAVALFNTSPAWAALLAFLLLRERLGIAGGACVAASIIGVVLVARPPFLFGQGGLDTTGAAIALGSAFFAGLVFTLIRKIARTEHPLTIVLYFYFAAAPLTALCSIPGWVTPELWEWPMLLALGYCTQAGQLNLTKGLALVSAGKASAGITLQIVFAGLWGALFFSEFPAWESIAGSVIIIGSTVAIGMFKEQSVPAHA